MKNIKTQKYNSTAVPLVVTWPSRAAQSCSRRSAVSCSWRLKQARDRARERESERKRGEKKKLKCQPPPLCAEAESIMRTLALH